jgi:ABC-2 type transport system permease protein
MIEVVRENLVPSLVLSKRAIKEIPRIPAALYPNLLIPIFFLAVNVGAFSRIMQNSPFLPPGTSYLGYQLPMALLLSVAGAASASGLAMVTDIELGYFDKLMLAPIGRFSIMIGRLIADFVRTASQTALVLTVGLIAGAPLKAGALGFVLLVLMGGAWGLVYAGIGLTIALRTGNAQATQASFVVFFPMIFLSTAFVPKSAMAGWIATVASYNPVTYLLDGLRSLILEGWVISSVLKALAAIAVVGSVTLSSAFLALRSRVS